MSDSILISEANLFDVKQANDVLIMLRKYACDIMGGNADLSDYVKDNLVLELQKRPSSIVLLGYDEENPVALCLAFEGFSSFYAKPLINIHDFVVSLEYRGRGIAKMLLDKVEEIAINRGCCKLTLEVLEGNIRAQKIYKDFGFAGYELNSNTGKALFYDKKLVYFNEH